MLANGNCLGYSRRSGYLFQRGREDQLNGLVIGAISIVVSGILLMTPTIPVESVQTSFTKEPISYKSNLISQTQVKTLCLERLVCNVTEIRYGIKNTDSEGTNFKINMVFRIGSEVESDTKSITVPPGEYETVKMKSPLRGTSTVDEINVVPPQKLVRHEQIVTKKISGFDYVKCWRLPVRCK